MVGGGGGDRGEEGGTGWGVGGWVERGRGKVEVGKGVVAEAVEDSAAGALGILLTPLNDDVVDFRDDACVVCVLVCWFNVVVAGSVLTGLFFLFLFFLERNLAHSFPLLLLLLLLLLVLLLYYISVLFLF